MEVALATFFRWFLASGWRYFAGALAIGAFWGLLAWEHGKGFRQGVKEQTVVTEKVQGQFDLFKRQVADEAHRAQSEYQLQKAQLQSALALAQAALLQAQTREKAKDKALNDLLAKAPPGDKRPLGPAARAYYDQLREGTSGP